ncbi:NADH:flavin oxidoreductase/NADH oxidase [Aminobacter sp. MSH1]|uniref:NADH:flavin oxidoreductase/NADH oxidase n=1 Tax=Aminobacter sp. MSH1 TaxID=374606 RepID=UPI000D38C132|nr:NADH:flavin oxidoreductase/NADH oxidase [Aminobacter sp. MSH1]
MTAKLFTQFEQRSITLPNRIVASPMAQYTAFEGLANDWHVVTYGKMAQGGTGLVMVEATATSADARCSYGDLGLWADDQIGPLKRVAGFIEEQGAVPGIQLCHAGRKAGLQRPWEGYGPLTTREEAVGETPWPVFAPSALPFASNSLVPGALTDDEMDLIIQQFGNAAARAARAGFKVLEIHAAHGFLINQFLSPLSNHRRDAWGGDAERRMAFPLAVVRNVRASWPDDLPLWMRVSAIDDVDGGRQVPDSIEFARAAKILGVDLVDCSTGGFIDLPSKNRLPRSLGYQVPFSDAIRRQADIPTMAVGLIVKPQHAEEILQAGQADVIGLGRELLSEPNWPLHARRALVDPTFDAWPRQFGWWLEKRQATFDRIGFR